MPEKPSNNPAVELKPNQQALNGSTLQHHNSTDGNFDSAAVSTGGDALPPAPSNWPQVTGFQIIGELGRGGMGVVYKAVQTGLNRMTALKMILHGDYADEEQKQRFHYEAEAVARLRHPNIVQIYEIGQHQGQPFFALEYCDGGTLRHKAKGGQLPPLEVAKIVEALARAVDLAHQNLIVHRDLKPDNVLLTADGTPKVTDFGLARMLEGEAVKTRPGGLTQSGAVVGTPHYMPPEQALGQRVGPAADIYALGAILYELLTGRPPFEGATVGEVFSKVLLQEPARPSRKLSPVPRDLEIICLKCLQKEAGARYASAEALAEDLRRFQAGEPIVARPAGRLERTYKWARRHPARAMALSLATVAVLLLGVGTVIASFWLEAENALTGQKAAEKKAEETRVALSEQTIGQAIEQGLKNHDDLHDSLKQPGGAQKLLNRPERWREYLNKSKSDLGRAKSLASNADAAVSAELTRRMLQLEKEIRFDTADFELAMLLEKNREEAGMIVDGKFNYTGAEEKYAPAFRAAKLSLEPGWETETAASVARSAIKEPLLAALDHWAWIAKENKRVELARRLLKVARLADPDPLRDKLRDPDVREKPQSIEKLADQILNDPGTFGQLSPSMLDVIGSSLALNTPKQVTWMTKAQRTHPTDFWIAFDLGTRLHDQGKAIESIGYFRTAIAIRPDSLATWNNLGNALNDQNDMAGCFDAYNTALRIDSNYGKAWFNLGNALVHHKDLPGAIEKYQKALACNPPYIDAWFNLGNAQRDNHDPDAAVIAYRKAIETNPKDQVGSWNNLGNVLREKKDLAGAVDAHKKALAIDPEYTTGWNSLGLDYREQGNLEGAVDAFNKAIAINAKDAKSWNYLGIALREQKNLPAAVEAYKKSIHFDPENDSAWYNLGIALGEQNDLPGAVAAYKSALKINPQYANAWYNLGNELRANKDMAGATAAFKKATEHGPENPKAWFNLGVSLHDQKDFTAAVDAYKNALKIDPKYVKAWFSLGNTLNAKDNLPGAADAFKKATSLDPNHADAWNNLGNVLLDQNDVAGAVEAYKKATALDPKSALMWTNLGVALRDNKDVPGAIEAYKKAVEINPKYARAWNSLGLALQSQKDLTGAVEAYKKAVAANPQYSFAWNNMGNALFDQNDLAGAAAAYNKAVEANPKNAGAWNSLGNVLSEQNDLPGAVKAYKKAVSINAKYTYAWNNLGNALFEQKDFPEAAKAYQQAVAADPKFIIAWTNLGNTYRRQRNLADAIEAYRKAIALNDKNARAHYGLGLVLLEQGEFSPALAAMQKAHKLGSETKDWTLPSAKWIAECERLIALDKMLPDVLQGKKAEAAEYIGLAELCSRFKKRYADATALYEKAFAVQPKLLDDLTAGHRYNAACAAVLATASKLKGKDEIADKEKAWLRGQALDWLKAELAARANLLAADRTMNVKIQKELKFWQTDPDLGSVREAKDLQLLPTEERADWHLFWEGVRSLVEKSRIGNQ